MDDRGDVHAIVVGRVLGERDEGAEADRGWRDQDRDDIEQIGVRVLLVGLKRVCKNKGEKEENIYGEFSMCHMWTPRRTCPCGVCGATLS